MMLVTLLLYGIVEEKNLVCYLNSSISSFSILKIKKPWGCAPQLIVYALSFEKTPIIYVIITFSNYTLRVMPLPLYDIGRIGIGVEEHVQSIQRYLCRNHSDERLKVEMAARHRSRLLSATQQSVCPLSCIYMYM